MKIIPTTYYQNTDTYRHLLAEYSRLGIDTLRINCTRANIEEYINDINMLRKEFVQLNGVTPNILMDLPLPKTKPRITFCRPIPRHRIAFNNGGDVDYYLIRKNELLTISSTCEENKELFFKISSAYFLDLLSIGDEVIVGENTMTMRLKRKATNSCVFEATQDGYISYGKYVHSDRCKTVMEDDYCKFQPLVAQTDPELIALSFVENKNDVECFRSTYSIKDNTKIISKIETLDGIRNLDEIVENSDMMMIARGDLYTHTNFNQFCYSCERMMQLKDRPVLAATGFLETIHSYQDAPLRSEIFDLYYHMKFVNGIVLAYQQSQDIEVINRCLSIIKQLII